MSSRSSGVMKVLCNNSIVLYVTVSACFSIVSIACTRISRSSKFVIKASISFEPLTHNSACWLKSSKNLPSVGIKRPNIFFSLKIKTNRVITSTHHTNNHVRKNHDGNHPSTNTQLRGLLVVTKYRQGTNIIIKLRIFTKESQANTANRAITLLTNNNFSSSFIRRIWVIDLITINKHDHVSILLNRTRFTQIRHNRTFIRSLLQ